jgi:hypothetical protein
MAVTHTLEELKDYVASQFDPDDIIEALNISSEQLVEAFEELVLENKLKFLEEEEEE